MTPGRFDYHTTDGDVLTIRAGGRELPAAAFRPADPDLAWYVVLDFDAPDAQVSCPVGVATNPLLGIEYKDSSYRGSTWTLYGTSGSGCYSGVSYGFYHISRFGWGDTISSAKAFSGCTGVHHEDGDASGSTYNCTCSSMGVMNDETSAIIFR